jgi:hypothetical protein
VQKYSRKGCWFVALSRDMSLLRRWSSHLLRVGVEPMSDPIPNREIDNVTCKADLKQVLSQRFKIPSLINKRSYLVLPSAIVIYVALQCILYLKHMCDPYQRYI